MLLKAEIYSGAGNTFLIFDNRTRSVEQNKKKALVQKATKEAGVDGFVFIEDTNSANADFVWDFYNNDGSPAKMCGNAARCVVLFAKKNELIVKSTDFETEVGLIFGESLGVNEAVVCLPLPKLSAVEIKSGKNKACFIDSGVPHSVVKTENIENKGSMQKVAAEFRHHKSAGAEGSNVTFVRQMGTHDAKVISFERGVENFTQACGTGAIAAAFLLYKENKTDSWINIAMPGGSLQVRFDEDQQKTWLLGPTEFIGEKYIETEL